MDIRDLSSGLVPVTYALLQPCCRGGCGVRAGCGRCCIMQAWSTQALRDAHKRPSFSFSAFFRPTVSASATCLRGGKPHGSPPQRVQPARSAPWTCGEPRKHIFAASWAGCKLGLSCDRKQQRFGLHRPGSKTENERPYLHPLPRGVTPPSKALTPPPHPRRQWAARRYHH